MTEGRGIGERIEAARALALRPEQDLLRMLAARSMRPSVVELAHRCYQGAADELASVLKEIEERKK